MRSLLTILFLMFSLASFAQDAEITADLTGIPEGTKFFLHDSDERINLDSAVVMNGKLTMRPKLGKTKGYYFQGRQGNEFYWCYLLAAANDKISISGTAKQFPFLVKITGSKEQDFANIYRSRTAQLNVDRDSIMKVLMPLAFGKQNDSIRNITRPMQLRVSAIDSTITEVDKRFVEEYYNSYYAVQQLYYLKGKYSKEELTAKLARLNPAYKQTSFAIRLNNFLRVGDPLKKGDKFFDFEAYDTKDKKYRISDFAGKYVLLDFTETYCGPCVLAVEDLKKLHNRFKDKLVIVSFYADKTKKVMLEGINRDKPDWLCVTDGKGPASDILLKYGVSGYPTFVLLDPAGKIVAKFSGYGKDDDGKGNVEKEVEKTLTQ